VLKNKENTLNIKWLPFFWDTLYTDNHLIWTTHIDKISKKIASAIGALKRIRRYITTDTAVQVYQALTQPHFDYCSSVCDGLGETLSCKARRTRAHLSRVLVIRDKLERQNFLVCGQHLRHFRHSWHVNQISNMFDIFRRSWQKNSRVRRANDKRLNRKICACVQLAGLKTKTSSWFWSAMLFSNMFDIWFTCHEWRKCHKCCPHKRKFCRSNLSRITSTRDKCARVRRA
jgi:hypothetical protein